MAVLQAINTATPRFLPVLRETCELPLWIAAIVGVDMRPQRTMEFRYEMARVVDRLKKQPHER